MGCVARHVLVTRSGRPRPPQGSAVATARAGFSTSSKSVSNRAVGVTLAVPEGQSWRRDPVPVLPGSLDMRASCLCLSGTPWRSRPSTK